MMRFPVVSRRVSFSDDVIAQKAPNIGRETITSAGPQRKHPNMEGKFLLFYVHISSLNV